MNRFMFIVSCLGVLSSCIAHDPICVVANTLGALAWHYGLVRA